jgi:hypothetical protein
MCDHNAMRTYASLAALTLVLVSYCGAQSSAKAADPIAMKERIESSGSQLTLDEEIELIVGDKPFRTLAIDRLGMRPCQEPQFRKFQSAGIVQLSRDNGGVK